jgi:hypothetical protein
MLFQDAAEENWTDQAPIIVPLFRLVSCRSLVHFDSSCTGRKAIFGKRYDQREKIRRIDVC